MHPKNDADGESKVRHILSISGGKDSAALAVYLRDRIPQVEYVFCDTHEELPETYEYIGRLEAFLGKPIHRLNPERSFEWYLRHKGGYLPSARIRWCTSQLKIKPFEAFVGSDTVRSYIGIRADEERAGYISTKPNIIPVYPFREDGVVLADVYRILEEAGLGLPSYYSWRSRSGCYFCFFQRRIEWVGLYEQHPKLFEKARKFEEMKTLNGQRFTWSDRESLAELTRPERIEAIKLEYQVALEREQKRQAAGCRLADAFSSVMESQQSEEACTICRL